MTAATRAHEAAASETDASSELFPRGNALRCVRGGATAAVGAFGAFLLMAHDAQLSFGVPLGVLFVAIASFGVMDLVGSFDDAGPVERSTTLGKLASPLVTLLVSIAVFALSLAGAASGLLRQWTWGVVVTGAFLGLVLSVYQVGEALGPWATDEAGVARPVWQREGFWVVTTSALLLLPCMGSYSLWDPWETHYGEVAREILARDDWISLWWAQDGWFWSKPVLDMWIQALFMATLGVHYQPDRMLVGVGGAEAHPEWVVRAPVALLAILAVYVLYKGVAKVFGRRAGLLGAIVLSTMPDWWALARQTMTDMPFVAPMTAAMGLMLVGLYTPDDEKVRVYEVKAGGAVWRVSSWHLVIGAVLVCALPQILYLFSRNLTLVLHGTSAHGFRAHYDEFRTGSGMGNCGLPGNEGCNPATASFVPSSMRGNVVGFVPSVLRFFAGFEPALQALLWSIALGFLLFLSWGERRAKAVAYLGAWLFCAVATLAKGPAGLGIPVIAGFAYVAATRRWKELVRFQAMSGLAIVLAIALPWGVAMFVRHGQAFTSRLITHDMFDRAFSHVHDTNEGDDTSFRFYIWQLGYALFPWTGLAPLGLVDWARRPERADTRRAQASMLLVMWFVLSFALFSFMGTKFHHYILPAVPPVAMLLGVALDDLLGAGPLLAAHGDKAGASRRDTVLYVLVLAAASALAVLGVMRALPGTLTGTKPGGALTPASHLVAEGLVGASIIVFFACLAYFRANDDRGASSPGAFHRDVMFAGATLAGALVLAVVGRDLAGKPDGVDPGAIRIVHLYTYNYRRPWPDALDYSAILAAFAAVGVGLGCALAVRRIRKAMIVAFFVFAGEWAVWGLDVYTPITAPHWGQHDLLATYYADRSGPDEPFVAYQMNWKGENFYTSNRVPAFVSGGGPLAKWLKEQRDKGVHVVYFVTEHGRVNGLKGEVKPKEMREMTDKTTNNKFVLVRMEI